MADVVGLKKETRGGLLFYEWDLALSPKECGMEQTLVQGVCFPDKVSRPTSSQLAYYCTCNCTTRYGLYILQPTCTTLTAKEDFVRLGELCLWQLVESGWVAARRWCSCRHVW